MRASATALGTRRPGIPALPDLYGRGPFTVSLTDEVRVPAGLAPGHYVLSWRWDAEQTKQVWSHCSDVVVQAAAAGQGAVAVAVARPPPSSRPRPPTKDTCVGASIGLDTRDCAAWMDFYDALDGPNWPAAWSDGCAGLREDPCGCDGTWQKWIVCSTFRDFARITEVYLLGAYLSGAIPDTFTQMTALRSLSLVDTRITGVLPSNMGDMAGLEMIWLDHNSQLGGRVPTSLGKLRITVLELHRSNFTGVLPPLRCAPARPACMHPLVLCCPCSLLGTLPPNLCVCVRVCARAVCARRRLGPRRLAAAGVAPARARPPTAA